MAKKQSARKNRPEWLSTAAAAQVLGIRPKTLLSLMPELERGRHWINISNSQAKRACYRWNLENLLAYFSQIN